jgi:thiamine-monophosphate kinase
MARRAPVATLQTLGEFGLIARLAAPLPRRGPGLLLGIGDDAAALRLPAGRLLLATTDLLLEGEDFRWRTADPVAVGWKALAVNVSDIAAMGGRPRYALLGLAVPSGTPVARLDALYRGLRRAAAAFRVLLVGGDVSATTGPLLLAVTVLGEAGRRLLTRAGARTGETLWVTGRLGASAAALAALSRGYRAAREAGGTGRGRPVPARLSGPLRRALRRHFRPHARVQAGAALAGRALASAAIDLSDGLAGDLAHLCEASGVGALVEGAAVPVDRAAAALGAWLRTDPLSWALGGGEDFELLFTTSAPPAAVRRALARAGTVGATAIGRILPRSAGLTLRHPDGTLSPLAGGFEHFRPGPAFRLDSRRLLR